MSIILDSVLRSPLFSFLFLLPSSVNVFHGLTVFQVSVLPLEAPTSPNTANYLRSETFSLAL